MHALSTMVAQVSITLVRASLDYGSLHTYGRFDSRLSFSSYTRPESQASLERESMYLGRATGETRAKRTSSLFSNRNKAKDIDAAIEKTKKSADTAGKKAKEKDEKDEKATGTGWIEVILRGVFFYLMVSKRWLRFCIIDGCGGFRYWLAATPTVFVVYILQGPEVFHHVFVLGLCFCFIFLRRPFQCRICSVL